ncbi:hypothetical protein BDZ45DRAFT_742780 [Acephala macrosclerotiorum]|nr:hypothetical protein BDZ45DRAFT_742780 [Acephala macrosclerotiorum]
MALFYESIPYLSDVGFTGYGSWSINALAALYENFTTVYTHYRAIYSSNVSQAVSLFQPDLDKLAQLNATDMTIMEPWQQLAALAFLTTAWLDGQSLTSNATLLREILEIIAGRPEEYAYHNLNLHGSQVFLNTDEPFSAVAPAWRKGYVLDILARAFAGASNEADVFEDVKFKNMGAMRALSPDTGSYMNEADLGDEMWKEDFIGVIRIC